MICRTIYLNQSHVEPVSISDDAQKLLLHHRKGPFTAKWNLHTRVETKHDLLFQECGNLVPSQQNMHGHYANPRRLGDSDHLRPCSRVSAGGGTALQMPDRKRLTVHYIMLLSPVVQRSPWNSLQEGRCTNLLIRTTLPTKARRLDTKSQDIWPRSFPSQILIWMLVYVEELGSQAFEASLAWGCKSNLPR